MSLRGFGRFVGIFVGLWAVGLGAGWAARIVPSSLFTDPKFVVVNAVTAVVTSVGAYLVMRCVPARPPEQRVAVDVRVRAAAEAIDQAARLVAELQAEIAVTSAALERVAAERVQSERLAAVRKDEAEAITQLIQSVIASTHATYDGRNRRSQLLFFGVGLLLSIPIGVLVNVLTK